MMESMTLQEARDEAIKGIPNGSRLFGLETRREGQKFFIKVTYAPISSATLNSCQSFQRTFDA